ncbi:hypothetical protein OEZ85_013460 [Tetradesmus obliquus]|uniref:Next to BRCA1 central domain-containing protein n=1 Tax=Tetradesmus obliquus TaxID=3088 RepID=A0ABY8URA4_TETOB|nr:hypothetical protein OEZ85_013460 [Tetradesmus obliquus]
MPSDVWAAAQLLGNEKGMRVVAVYKELADQRVAAVHHMTLNHTRRTQQQQHTLTSSTSSAASPAGLAGSGLLNNSSAHYSSHSSTSVPASSTAAWLSAVPGDGTKEPQQSLHRTAGTAAPAPGQLLSRRTVMDSIVESHDERVMARWEAQQAQWRAQAAVLCAATGKQERDLTLSRGNEWRRKLELLAALEVAVPAAAAAAHKVNKAKIISKDGGYNSSRPNSDSGSGSKGSINDGDSAGTVAAASGQWIATLRNANERFVMIGNIFSGLFLSIHSNNAVAAAGLTTIRKPAQPAQSAQPHATAAAAAAAAAGASLTASSSSSKPAARRRSWMERPYLKQKLTDGAAAVKALAPAAPDAEALVVTGSSLDCAGLAASLVLQPVGLAAVEARLAVADPGLFKEYQVGFIHDPGGECMGLVVTGSSLDCAGLAASLAVQPVGLAAVEARLAVADPALFKEYQPVGLAAVEARLAVADPALFKEYQAAQSAAAAKAAAEAAAAAEQQRRAAARTAAATLPYPGPHLRADTDALSLTYSIPPAHATTAAQGTKQPVLVDGDGGVVGSSSSSSSSSSAGSAELTVVNTGTAAVYFSWSCSGRQRPPQAGYPQQHQQEQQVDEADVAPEQQQQFGAGGDACSFYLPQQQGVILPGEQQRFRFSFKAQQPGIYHESWALACHPPLLPDPEAPAGSEARKKGHCIRLHLKGTSVTSGSAVPGEEQAWAAAAAAAAAAAGSEGAGRRGGLQQEQQQLEARLARQCRDAQVQSVLELLLSRVVQQAASQQQQQQQQQQQGAASDSSAGVTIGLSSLDHAAAAAKFSIVERNKYRRQRNILRRALSVNAASRHISQSVGGRLPQNRFQKVAVEAGKAYRCRLRFRYLL